MSPEQKRQLKQDILNRLEDAAGASQNTADARAPVELDQQSIGRLSRMDALQNQAMARASETRRRNEMAVMKDALLRLDDDDFGYCEDCGEAIPMARISINPGVRRCVDCS